MALMGRLGARFDARLLISTGVLLFLWSMWLHYHFTTAIGMHDLFWPMVLRGVGLGFIFVPLTGAAVADLRPDQLAQGTGLFNLSRQLGGSFGIAVTATLLSRFTEQSREALLPHLAAWSPAARGWLDQATAPAREPRRLPARGAAAGAGAARVGAAPAGLDGRVREGVSDHGDHLRRGPAAAAAVPDGPGAGWGGGALSRRTRKGRRRSQRTSQPGSCGDPIPSSLRPTFVLPSSVFPSLPSYLCPVTFQRKLLFGFSLMVLPALLVGAEAIRSNALERRALTALGESMARTRTYAELETAMFDQTRAGLALPERARCDGAAGVHADRPGGGLLAGALAGGAEAGGDGAGRRRGADPAPDRRGVGQRVPSGRRGPARRGLSARRSASSRAGSSRRSPR